MHSISCVPFLKQSFTRWFAFLLGAFCGVLFGAPLRADAAPTASAERANALQSQGNYNDAYQMYRTLLLDSDEKGEALARMLGSASVCLQSLDRLGEVDELIEAVVKKHSESWEVLRAAAQQYRSLQHGGYELSGAFVRGWARGGQVKYQDASARDRVRALQLFSQAISNAEKGAKPPQTAALYEELAECLQGEAAWKLQALTDLSKLPDTEEGYYYSRSMSGSAPVDAEGQPILYRVPSSMEAAESDGERWRFALDRAAKLDPSRADRIQFQFAQFLEAQFGVRTLADGYRYFAAGDRDEDNRKGIFSLRTLKDEETIARLADGIKRLTLPAEFNFIGILKGLAESGSYRQTALETLAAIFEDRQQYSRAAEYWKRAIELGGPGSDHYRQKRLDQIVGAWGTFQPTSAQASGASGSFEFEFRNATSVTFDAYEIRSEALLDDTLAYLRSNPKELEWERIQFDNVGYGTLTKHQEKYVGEKVGSWTVPLTPREEHFTRRVTLEAPVKEAGAYLLIAKVAGGNTTKAILWLNDTAIVQKRLDNGLMFFVADAKSGAPLKNQQAEFFGYQQEYLNRTVLGGRVLNILTKSFTAETDETGIIRPSSSELNSNYQWLTIIRGGKTKRFATLGFSSVWTGRYYDAEYRQRKTYGITDRPVFRPLQKVQYKVWLRNAQYDQEKDSEDAGRNVNLVVTNPRGERMIEKNVTLDQWGGFEGSIDLGKDAQLGVYSIALLGFGSAVTFRVEEYKKPEFEVSVSAPSEPVMLGEKIKANVEAKYYFGSPVTKAKVHYKVQRSDTTSNWYPRGIWDWFYGPGYWWFAYDYRWYPHWLEWGCIAPRPWWIWSGQQNPPELVQDREVEIGPDGKLAIDIDTQVAKELHPDTDHRYQITVEVVDESRRQIVGTGSVLVTRKPFKVYTWLDRGYYRSGDTIAAHFSAQTADNKPVQGKGVVKLLALSYDAKREPVEKEVEHWDLDTNDEGNATLQIKASRLGQYRLSYTVADKASHSVEGGYVFTIAGEGFNGKGFRFNDIELIPEKREYAPGEKVALQINTDQADSTVLLFSRPANGVYLPPEVIRLDGKSTLRDVLVTKKDMPNFFLEAVTVRDGRVYSQMREIIVPPEKRVINVEVLPSASKYKPGQDAEVELKMTDLSGKPVSGTAVLSVYDKSVEYISGGSNVTGIREYFWKWRRRHSSTLETNLMRTFAVILPPGTIPMSPIGVFGGMEEQLEESEGGVEQQRFERRSGVKAKGEAMAPASARGGAAQGFAQSAAPPMRAQAESALSDSLSDVREKDANKKQDSASGGAGESDAPVEPAVRKEFADTAFWNGKLEFQEGSAKIHFKMPENLTTWKMRAWALGEGTRVGEASVDVVTTKNLLLRLQAPRFFVEKDEVVLSANIHNALATEKSVTAKLEVPGELVSVQGPAEQSVKIQAGGEARVDWRVKVIHEGEAVIRMLALTDEESDAMEVKLPSYVHGMLKTESYSGVIRPTGTNSTVEINVPSERRPEQTRLEVRYSPTLAGAMVDALPYLVNFPYGCTEQTLNRFLPTVITQKVLRDMGLNLKEIREKLSNLNAQEIGNDRERSKGWKRYREDPVFDEAAVQDMLRAGIERLTAMQLSGGGWGWFSGSSETPSAHLTAGVVHGLQIARAAGVEVPESLISRGIGYLRGYEAGELRKLKNAPTATKPYKENADELDVFVHMVLLDGDSGDAAMREYLYRDRNRLSVYAKAMEGLIFVKADDLEKAKMLRKNIEQFLVQDDENQTAYLNLGNGGYWWFWYGSEFEAQAYYLKLLTKMEPKSEIAPRLVKYLLNNRKNATYWSSTRDTAIIIEAFADYLKVTGETDPDLSLEVLIDGKTQKEVKIDRNNLFTYDNAFILEGMELESGKHTLELKKKGKGPIYFNAYLTNFTLEDSIKKAGLEIKVERKYYKLVQDKDATELARGGRGQALAQKVDKYRREPLASPAALKSGDLVEVELEIESKNDYEYLLFEDMKPAGFEPLEVRSGYNGNAMGAYVEFRDERVAFFVRTLPRGKRSVSYRLRAEIPGSFSALPTRASAMYAPELKANSDELKASVSDQ